MSCWQDGSPDSPILLVGMAPGTEELAHDRPFVGPSGRLLWSLLKKAGIDRSDCYILNVIGEWPEGKNGGPTPAQIDKWWNVFDSNCALFKGQLAFLLGGDALFRFTGLEGGIAGKKSWGGYLVPSTARRQLTRNTAIETVYKTSTKTHKKGDVRLVKVKETVEPPPFNGLVLPALHPAGVLRTGLATVPILAAQARRLARAWRGNLLPSRTYYVEYPVVWAKAQEVAVDIETGGIDNGITRLGCAREDDAFSVPWTASARGVALDLLGRRETTYLLHNASFDLPRLALAGTPVEGPVCDTMLAAALLQPDLPKGLNACGGLYLDCEKWKHLDAEAPAKYNAYDAIRTYELWQQEKTLLEGTGQMSLFRGTIMRGLPTLINMGQTGIRISLERRDAWLGELRERGARLLGEWDKQTAGVDYASPHQLKKYFRSMGIDVPFNKHGAETTDKQGLARLKADFPETTQLLDLLIETRSVFKDIETYANVEIGSDLRVHPSFMPAYKDEDEMGKGLSGTWRPTSTGPNLQNQHTKARCMYIPSEGMVFVGADYAQLEARILAGLSGDDQLLADCNTDIHDRNAKRLGVDKTRAKNGFYGWSYLAGARTLQHTFAGRGFKVSLKECEELLAGFDKTYTKAASFRRVALATAQAQRYVQNPFGLRRYFPHQKFPAPSAMSTLIQSTGAIMMWRILPQLEAALAGLSGRLLLTVHDDILGEVPAEARDAALGRITEIMGQSFHEIALNFKVPVTPKSSPDSWGAMTDAAK